MTEEDFQPVEPHPSEAFKYNGVIHVYDRCPVECLQTLVPGEAGGKYRVMVSEAVSDDDGNELSPATYRQMTRLELIGGESRVNYSPDGTECTYLEAGMDAPLYRQKPVTQSDFDQWQAMKSLVGDGDKVEMLTYAENQALLAEWYKVDDETDTI